MNDAMSFLSRWPLELEKKRSQGPFSWHEQKQLFALHDFAKENNCVTNYKRYYRKCLDIYYWKNLKRPSIATAVQFLNRTQTTVISQQRTSHLMTRGNKRRLFVSHIRSAILMLTWIQNYNFGILKNWKKKNNHKETITASGCKVISNKPETAHFWCV